MYKANTATAMLNAQKAAMAPGMPAPAPGPELGSQVGTGRLRSYTPMRLRLNTVLNAMTSRGSFVGNNAGVLGRLLPCDIFRSSSRPVQLSSTMASTRPSTSTEGGTTSTGACWQALVRERYGGQQVRFGLILRLSAERVTAGLRPMVIASGLMTAGAAAWTLGKPYIIVRAAGRTDSVTDETSVTNTFFGVIGSASAVGPHLKGLPRRIRRSGCITRPSRLCPVLCLPFICTRRSPRVPTRQSKTSAGRHQEVSASPFISSTTNRALLE
jgi:hypothetical protein